MRFFLRCFNILCYASGFYMLVFVIRCLCCARMRARVCVIHWHCSAQLSMFNMEKRYRNKIIIIIIIIIITSNCKYFGRRTPSEVLETVWFTTSRCKCSGRNILRSSCHTSELHCHCRDWKENVRVSQFCCSLFRATHTTQLSDQGKCPGKLVPLQFIQGNTHYTAE